MGCAPSRFKASHLLITPRYASERRSLQLSDAREDIVSQGAQLRLRESLHPQLTSFCRFMCADGGVIMVGYVNISLTICSGQRPSDEAVQQLWSERDSGVDTAPFGAPFGRALPKGGAPSPSGLGLKGSPKGVHGEPGQRPAVQRHAATDALYMGLMQSDIIFGCVALFGREVDETAACWRAFANIVICDICRETPHASIEPKCIVLLQDWDVVCSSSKWRRMIRSSGEGLARLQGEESRHFWNLYVKPDERGPIESGSAGFGRVAFEGGIFDDGDEWTDGTIMTVTTNKNHIVWEHAYSRTDPRPGVTILDLCYTTMLSGNTDPSLASDGAGLFDELEIGSLLGRGGFGAVYRATWRGTLVAVKLIDGVRLVSEAELGMQLHHKNVVCTLATASRQVEDDEQQTVIVLELCDGGSLRQVIENGALVRKQVEGAIRREPCAVVILQHIATGMAYLHEKHILHGDLSLNNVLLDSNNVAKVSDFGLSRMYSGNTVQTRTHGTITHMAPELLESGTLSLASDVYSFGVIACEMYCTTTIYENLTQLQIMRKKSSETPESLVPSRLPACLKDIVTKCLQRDHRERPTFQNISSAMDEVVQGE